MEALSAPLL
jgi:hypothetical protein